MSDNHQTAQEIAAMFAADGKHGDLEIAVLRHMEHHIKTAILAEREACAKIALRYNHFSDDCEHRGCMDMETGEVPCALEAHGSQCECTLKIEHGDAIAATIRARGEMT